MSRTTARRLLLATTWAWLSTSCAGDKGGDTATREPACSDWVGLIEPDGDPETWMLFDALRPPHENVELDLSPVLDLSTNELKLWFDLDASPYDPHNEFDVSYSANGIIRGTCDALGLTVYEQSTTWVIDDPMHRYEVEARTTTTWVPPRLLLPHDPEVGDRWTNAVQQITTSSTGKTSSTALHEEFEVLGVQLLTRTVEGEHYAIVIQDSNGHRSYFARGYGLFLGLALVKGDPQADLGYD